MTSSWFFLSTPFLLIFSRHTSFLSQLISLRHKQFCLLFRILFALPEETFLWRWIYVQTKLNFLKLHYIYIGGTNMCTNTGVLISPCPDQEGNKLGSMSETRAISTTSRRQMSSFFPPLSPPRQGAERNSRHSDRTVSLFPSWSG